jgi:hypothetical protein
MLGDPVLAGYVRFAGEYDPSPPKRGSGVKDANPFREP